MGTLNVEKKWVFPLIIGSLIGAFLLVTSLNMGLVSSVDTINLLFAILPIIHVSTNQTNPTFVEDKVSVPPPLPAIRTIPQIAYLVSGSRGDLEKLWRTLCVLYHPWNLYVVHLNLESPMQERLELAKRVENDSIYTKVGNVHIITKANMVTYRGPTMVSNTLHAMAILLKKSKEWDWFINLSASDYPLVTQDDLLSSFSRLDRNLNFIDHTSRLGWKEGQRAKPLIFDPRLYKTKKADVFWAKEKRDMPTAFKLFIGMDAQVAYGFHHLCDEKSYLAQGPISNKADEGITIDQLHKLNQKNISAWNMKRMMNIVRHGALSTLDEQILELTDEEEAAKEEIKSEFEAKCAAKKSFTNAAKPGSKYIYLDDLMLFMRHDEALKTMSLFEGAAETKRVKKSSLKNWVVRAFRERKALALTLDDTKTAVNQLHRMVNDVVVMVIFVIWLLILWISTTQLLVFISSQLLLVAFMFGNNCKMVFEAIIFLFVMHPFDVGDSCEIDDIHMVVEEMNILTTVFLRYDNKKIIYPNSVHATKPISNYYRSPDMGDGIDFCTHISTPVEKIALMKKRIIVYIENKPEHWASAPMVVVRDVEDMNKLKLSVWLCHCINHQDMGERWVRRSLLVEEMIKIFKELDMEYQMLPVDVNARNMPSLSTGRLPSNWTACTTKQVQ